MNNVTKVSVSTIVVNVVYTENVVNIKSFYPKTTGIENIAWYKTGESLNLQWPRRKWALKSFRSQLFKI